MDACQVLKFGNGLEVNGWRPPVHLRLILLKRNEGDGQDGDLCFVVSPVSSRLCFPVGNFLRSSKVLLCMCVDRSFKELPVPLVGSSSLLLS